MSGADGVKPGVIVRLIRVHDSIFGVLAAGIGLRSLLAPGHPPLGEALPDGRWEAASLAVGVAHYGARATFHLWVMCRAVAALEHEATHARAMELWSSCIALARAVDNVLIAVHGLRAALKLGHPSLGEMAADGVWVRAPLALGYARYGTTPLFPVWRMCVEVVALRAEWTGDPGPAIEAAPPEPDEALGLTPEAPPSPDVGGGQQPRLVV